MSRRLTLATGIALLVSLGRPAAAQIYDAVNDFSLASNQNVAGVWSYGQAPTRGGAFSLLANADTLFAGASGVEGWRGGVPGFQGGYPVIAHNTTGATVSYLTITHPADLLNLHPGPNGENAVLRWIAPAAGLYRVQGRFQGLDSAPTTTDPAILLNQVTTLFAGGINVAGGGNSAGFDITVPLAAGDRVDFSVGFGNGFYGNDSTGLAATIRPAVAAVPEPGTLCLIGALVPAAGALVPLRRRCRKQAGQR